MLTAAQIKRQHDSGYAVQALLYPSQGCRDDLRRRGIEPTDHHKKNLKEMRQKAKLVKENQQAKELSKNKVLYKNPKYTNVESVVSKSRSNSVAPVHKKSDSTISVHRSSSLNLRVKRSAKSRPQTQPSEQTFDNKTTKPVKTHQLGEVPHYLQMFKKQMAEEKAQKEAEKNQLTIPPGYRLLSEEEKQDMIRSLIIKKGEAEQMHRRLPIQIDTDAQKKRKKNIENQILEYEKLLEQFQRPKVLVELE